jgi:DNA-directed RNA polymerase I, II, and III subunit RPABC2
MYEENDYEDDNIEDDNEYDDNEEEDLSDIIVDDDEKVVEDNSYKLTTYENIVENSKKKPKKTVPFLTKFEKARIIGVRLQQLAYGAKPRVDTSNLKSIQEIVEKELLLRRIPFIIRRTLPNGQFEDWKINEFEEVN